MLKDTAHKSSCQSKKASIHVRPPAPCLSAVSCSFPGDTVGFYLTHWSASTGSLAEPLWLSFSKSLFYSLWWIPNVLRTSANYQYFSLDCSLVSKTDCSLVNHQNNKNNVLAQYNPSKCFEGCGKHRVALAHHRLLLKTKKSSIQIKIVGVGTEIEIVMTGLGNKRSIFLPLYSDIQGMCRLSDLRAFSALLVQPFPPLHKACGNHDFILVWKNTDREFTTL